MDYRFTVSYLPGKLFGRAILLEKERYYWQGYMGDIRAMCDKCRPCIQFRVSQPSLLMKMALKSTTEMLPMSDCGTDIWEYGKKKYLILIDRLSGFILCENIPKMTLKDVIAQLCK
jgi:hypothetical protein